MKKKIGIIREGKIPPDACCRDDARPMPRSYASFSGLEIVVEPSPVRILAIENFPTSVSHYRKICRTVIFYWV